MTRENPVPGNSRKVPAKRGGVTALDRDPVEGGPMPVQASDGLVYDKTPIIHRVVLMLQVIRAESGGPRFP